jgi:DNA-binding transcriptional LysR family regulator
MDWDDRIGRRLRPKDLHTLKIVAELGSMAKASAELGLSQPAISKAVAELEQMLGTALLDRSARGVELTEAGRLLIERSRVIFDELRQCVRDIEHLADPTRGEIRIGSTAPLTVFVSQVISRMSRVYPHIRYNALVSDTKTLLAALRERELDIVITRWMPDAEPDDLEAEHLFAAPLAVLAEKGHPLVSRKGLSLADLMEEAWVLPPPEGFLGRIITEIFARRGLSRPIPLVTTFSVYMQLNLVAGARLLTMLPARMARYRANLAWLRTLDIDFPDSAGPIAAVTVKRRRLTGPLPLFQRACREASKVSGDGREVAGL